MFDSCTHKGDCDENQAPDLIVRAAELQRRRTADLTGFLHEIQDLDGKGRGPEIWN